MVRDATQSWVAVSIILMSCLQLLSLRQVHRENLTGTRGAYRPYNTAAPKVISSSFVVAANPASLAVFEPALFGPFTVILTQDIDRKAFLPSHYPNY